MLTTIRYILLTALRDRLFVALLLGIVFSTFISAALGNTAFLEEKAMTLSYAASSARLILMVGMIVFVCFHVRSAFDSKEIDVILSRPVSRTSLALAYWMGFSCVALLLALPIIGVMGFLHPDTLIGFAGWSASLCMEVVLVVALALFSALTLRSAVTSVLACMGFYVLSRMMAFFVIAAEATAKRDTFYEWMEWALVGISTVIPRLDFFAKSEWLIYGFDTAQTFTLPLIQMVIFVPLLLLASIADFRRKQF